MAPIKKTFLDEQGITFQSLVQEKVYSLLQGIHTNSGPTQPHIR
jgi:hypothetical protein